jgi:hypothetical protein
MKNQNSGQIRMIEAFLAVLIIFSSFAVTANLTVTQKTARRVDLASVGLQALIKLDSDGSLGNYIDDGNWTALRDALNLVLPVSVAFNLTVYNEQMQQVNTAVVSNGALSSQDVAFVEYLCASRASAFRCYVIHLNLGVAA